MKDRIVTLDLLRGIASLLVCAQHLRHFLFLDFGQLHSPSVLLKPLYLLGTLGHQAVMVFFVLSGYFVGGSILASYATGRWSWPSYGVKRISRLWMVLLPALLFTFLFDSVGRRLNPAAYAGSLHELYHLSFTTPLDVSPLTALGNAFFLQTLASNCFGTNSPLWSLAYEFWYYVLIALLLGIVFSKSTMKRVGHLIAAAVLIYLLPSHLELEGLNFLLGVGVYQLSQLTGARRILSKPLLLWISGALAIAAMVGSIGRSNIQSDLIIGLFVAVWVATLVCQESNLGWLKALAIGLSNISYSLYLFHFPFMTLVVFTFLGGRKFEPNLTGCLLYAGLLIATVAAATAFWWCFERHTARIQKAILAAVEPGKKALKTQGA